MVSRLRHRLRPPSGYEAFAIALAFLALGSGSYAAITVTGKNVRNSSLTGKDVKNRSLRGADIRKSSLTTTEVKDRSLLGRDFKAGQLPAGEQGLKGEQGPKGDRGPSFGDSTQVSAPVTVPRCDTTTVASYNVTLTSPSRIYAAGQAVYTKSGDRPENPSLQIALRDAGDTTTLAQSADMTDGSLDDVSNNRNGLHTSGVLMTPAGSGVYVAPAGTYKLVLTGGAFGNCGTVDPTMESIALSHIVLGNG